MTFDLKKILESKRAFRRELAARSIPEKLRMLDALRERALSLHPTVHEKRDKGAEEGKMV